MTRPCSANSGTGSSGSTGTTAAAAAAGRMRGCATRQLGQARPLTVITTNMAATALLSAGRSNSGVLGCDMTSQQHGETSSYSLTVLSSNRGNLTIAIVMGAKDSWGMRDTGGMHCCRISGLARN